MADLDQAIIRLLEPELLQLGRKRVRFGVLLPRTEPLENIWSLEICGLEEAYTAIIYACIHLQIVMYWSPKGIIARALRISVLFGSSPFLLKCPGGRPPAL